MYPQISVNSFNLDLVGQLRIWNIFNLIGILPCSAHHFFYCWPCEWSIFLWWLRPFLFCVYRIFSGSVVYGTLATGISTWPSVLFPGVDEGERDGKEGHQGHRQGEGQHQGEGAACAWSSYSLVKIHQTSCESSHQIKADRKTDVEISFIVLFSQ